MQSWKLAITLAAISLLLAFALAAAQEPVRDFSQLNTRLKPGDTIWVTDGQGRQVKGRINSLAPDSLGVDAGGFRTFSAGDVTMIHLREGDSLANGALIGLAVGAVAGALVMVAVCDGEAGCAPGGALLGAGAGAGIGVGIDAARGGKRVLAYRAPGASGSACLSLAPLIMPRTKGVAVAFSF